MKSSIYYMSKKQQIKIEQELDQRYQNRILHDMWEKGLWQHVKGIISKNDFKPDWDSAENIFAEHAAERDALQDDSNFWYAVLDDKQDKIYILNGIAENRGKPGENWSDAEFDLNDTKYSIKVRYAQLDDIKNSSLISNMIENYGNFCCLQGAEVKGSSSTLQTFIPSSEIEYHILELATPFSELPGVQEEKDRRAGKNKITPDKMLLNLDFERADIRPLDSSVLTDSNLGHWDLYWPQNTAADPQYYAPLKIAPREARNPANDIQSGAVAIDFGTTSTVVARKEGTGKIRLLRVGVRNMQEKVQPKHYENPTVLSFENYAELSEAWQDVPYRPFVRWQDVQCSHEAKAHLTESDKYGRVMSGLKTWIRDIDKYSFKLKDAQGQNIEFTVPHSISPDVSDFRDTEFNPVELYAFFLGLYINNQLIAGGRIYCDYYLTFPVKFDRATRDRILASFTRGLSRSYPTSLVYGTGLGNIPFSVTEHANEPSAYAAAILPLLPAYEKQDDDIVAPKEQSAIETNGLSETMSDITSEKTEEAPELIKATEEGVPFGVFDFGGGTTDFCFGLYRLPTQEERTDMEWEQVLDILDSSGDENLGGEHLVQQLAYTVIKKNKDELSANNISFTLPAEHVDFSGDEMLFSESAHARTNTALLCSSLRPLWEEGKLDPEITSKNALNQTFIDNDDKNVANMQLEINVEELKSVLKNRIEKGINAFFTAYKQAFKNFNITPGCLHIILAGNSCNSPLVMKVFRETKIKLFPDEAIRDTYIIHKPFLPNPDEPESVTLKTGVAIGMLKTLDAEPIGIIMRRPTTEESYFSYTIGRLENDKFKPVLLRGSDYHHWETFGKVLKHGKMKFLYSSTPLAIEENLHRGDDSKECDINWGKDFFGKTILVSAIKPTTVVFVLSDNGRILEETKKFYELS